MRPPCRCRTGLGLVEMLIALGITAMLLTSVAIAFHASMNSFETNQRIATATHNARMLLHRMMSEARCADDVAVTGTRTTIRTIVGANLHESRYEWNGGKLYYRRFLNGQPLPNPDTDENKDVIVGGPDGVLVTAFTVSAVPGVDSEGLVCTKKLTAQVTLRVGNDEFTVNASTAPRRNQDW